jgi:hypothetical protein
MTAVIVLTLTSCAVYIVRHSLLEGHPPPVLPMIWSP